MRYFLEYPLNPASDGGAWIKPENMIRFAQAAEAAGVSGIALTDHPAPSRKWLEAGGHSTLDPFVGLGFFAAATSSIRLMTYLTVVPYRNPFVLAKAMTSVDVLSGGRATFVLGTGYLRSEFAGLNVDFENRNELFDEGMEVVRGVLSNPTEFRHEGKHFTGLGVAMSPGPVQSPYPPMWLGGNAAVVRRRVAEWGNGWAPLTLGGAMMGKVSRTAPILSLEQFGGQIVEIKEQMESLGRDPESLDVASSGTTMLKREASLEEKLDHVSSLASFGVTWTTVAMDKVNFENSLEDLAFYGENIIAKTA